MSAAKSPIRLPILPATLAAVLLAIGIGLLLLSFFSQSNASNNRQSSFELAKTIDQLATVVNSNTAEWIQSDQLAQLVASSDVQVSRLAELNAGAFAFLLPVANTDSAREVGADWKLLREGLLALNQASHRQATVDPDNRAEAAQTPPPKNPVTTESTRIATVVPDAPGNSAQTPVPQEVQALAESFTSINSSVTEGTRIQSLIDLVESVSDTWAQVGNGNADDLAELVLLQKDYAVELLRLSGAGTQQSLFGYYTSNQIIDYTEKLNGLQLPDPIQSSGLSSGLTIDKNTSVNLGTDPSQNTKPVSGAAPVVTNAPEGNEIEGNEIQTNETQEGPREGSKSALVENAFVNRAVLSLQDSIARLSTLNVADTKRPINWIALAALTGSLLLLLFVISKMVQASNILRVRSAVSVQASSQDAPHELHQNSQGEWQRERMQETQQARRGAMSLREADQLIEDISVVANGDLRRPVPVPGNGHAKVIAETVNRSGKVIGDLVEMTRGVAERLNRLVKGHENHSRILAELDISRQTETAEMSDGISLRSEQLNYQRELLSNSDKLTKEIETRSESTVNGANEVSASLANMSAQVEIGVERMQRLLNTAASVTEATGMIKELTEKTRLQALNISLKIPAAASDTVSPYSEFDNFIHETGKTEASGDAVGLFDDIHQLTGKLVMVSSEADSLISTLQRDAEETAQALKQSRAEMNESAHHTLSTSLLGKELASYTEQLRDIVTQTVRSIESQQSELSHAAERLVHLDKIGNDYSELTLTLSQDLAGLQEMSSRLEESVSSFKIRGEVPLE